MIGLPVKMNNDSITVFKGDTSRLKNIIPIQERVEPNFYQQEVARIFKKAWLIVGSAEDLTEIGAYKVVDVQIVVALTEGIDRKIPVGI